MKPIVLTSLVVLASACSYSHIGPAVATFNRPTPPLGAGSLETQVAPLTLAIRRHLDTVVHGPDVDEDQLLVLKIHNYGLNVRLPIPSNTVTPDFTASRFGPTSKGQTFSGYLIIRKITPGSVEAYLYLDVTATTSSGSYSQTAKFRGNYTFIHSDEDVTEPHSGL